MQRCGQLDPGQRSHIPQCFGLEGKPSCPRACPVGPPRAFPHSPHRAAHLLTADRPHMRLQGMHWQTRASQYCWSVQLFMASQPRGVPSMAAEREESGYRGRWCCRGPCPGDPRAGGRPLCLRLGLKAYRKICFRLSKHFSTGRPRGGYNLGPGDTQGEHPGLCLAPRCAPRAWGCVKLPAAIRAGTCSCLYIFYQKEQKRNQNDC